jgi:hypothetical protein
VLSTKGCQNSFNAHWHSFYNSIRGTPFFQKKFYNFVVDVVENAVSGTAPESVQLG